MAHNIDNAFPDSSGALKLSRHMKVIPLCVKCGKCAAPYSDHCTPCRNALKCAEDAQHATTTGGSLLNLIG